MQNVIEISEDKIKKEFETIKQGKDNGYSTGYNWNEIILYFQWKEFYKKEIELWNENKIYRGLPLQSWIYLNRLKYIGKGAQELTFREILRAFKITGLHIGNSFHSPFYIQQFIKDYNIKSILDYSGGWGHRLLGAWNIPYIYNDINTVTMENCKRMAQYFKLKDKIFYSMDSKELKLKEAYEACFSCPPYWNTEIYSKNGAENLSYNEFLNDWWETTILNTFLFKDKCKYFAFIINHHFKNDMEQKCIEMGLIKIKEIRVGKASYSHLEKGKHNDKKGEFLLIFTKKMYL